MTWPYGTKHAGYNWQMNPDADYAQPVDAPCLLQTSITLSLSAWVVLHWTRKTSEASAVHVIQKSLHGS
jgi:hypothetical protein